MSPRAKRVLSVTLLILFVFRPGIGSLATWIDLDREGTRRGLIYSGLRFDLRSAFDDNYWQHFPPAKLICLVDTPASLFSDTLALPVTAVIEYRRARRTDERLFGTWKSDRTRSLEEYHRIYDSYGLSQETVQKATSGFGKRTLTFSGTDMLVESEAETHSYRFRVIQAETNGVALRWRPSGTSNEFLDIEFDKDGFWLMAQSGACKEFFRKEARPNKISGANAGGPHRLPIRALWAARIAQFRRLGLNGRRMRLAVAFTCGLVVGLAIGWFTGYIHPRNAATRRAMRFVDRAEPEFHGEAVYAIKAVQLIEAGDSNSAVKVLAGPIASYYRFYASQPGTNEHRLRARAVIDEMARTNSTIADRIQSEMARDHER